jgi:hypothetical protein
MSSQKNLIIFLNNKGVSASGPFKIAKTDEFWDEFLNQHFDNLARKNGYPLLIAGLGN